MLAKNVLVIQHSPGVRPAYVKTFFTEQNVPYELLPLFDSDIQSKLPDINTTNYSAIVSLGGHQGAYEDDKYPYLKWEKSFLNAQLNLKTPILGICLGAQLLAGAIGGYCHIGRFGYEAGYVNYELTSEGRDDAVLSKVFEEQQNKPLLLMHHQDSFDLPSNASVLAYTSNNYIAAFRISSALAVQFHPEASFTEFNEWVQNKIKNKPEVCAHLNTTEILSQAQKLETQAAKSRHLFFSTWWNSIHQ